MIRQPDEAAWDAAAALHERAEAALEAGRRDALTLAEAAHAALVVVLGEAHPDAANALRTVARARLAAGDLPGAEEAAAGAVAVLEAYVREPVVGPMRVAALATLGEVRIAAGAYEDAASALRLARDLAARVHGPASTELARALNTLGVACKFAGRYAEAARAYARAVAIAETHGETEGPMMAALLHNLGGLAFARGRPAEGEPHARRGLEVRERLVEAGVCPAGELAADLVALAAIVDACARHAEAEALLRRARALGDAHGLAPDRVLLSNLAACRHAQGDGAEAIILLESALAATPGDHSDRALFLHNLAVVRWERGEHDVARATLDEALEIARVRLPPRHPRRMAMQQDRARMQ